MTVLQALADKYECDLNLGYVYLMEFNFKKKSGKEKLLYKIGITTYKPIDRLLQISRSFFNSRRYIPESRLIRYRKVPNYVELEKILHNKLNYCNFKFKDKFDGCTEFFDIDKDSIIDVYESEVPLLKKK